MYLFSDLLLGFFSFFCSYTNYFLHQELIQYILWPNTSHYLFLWIKFYWNEIITITFLFVYRILSCYKLELSRYSRVHLAQKAYLSSGPSNKKALNNLFYSDCHLLLFCSCGSYLSREIVIFYEWVSSIVFLSNI